MTVVIDASVAVKAFFPEEGSEACRQFLRHAGTPWAPDHIYTEFAHAASRYVRRFDLPLESALVSVNEFQRMPVQLESNRDLSSDALRLAVSAGCTVYDALYLSVAVKHGCQLATADHRLARILLGGPLSTLIRLVG